MKRSFALILALLLLLGVAALAEDNPLQLEDGWSYVGYTYGGITFPVPSDYAAYELTDADRMNGYVLIGGSADYTLALRAFPPEQMTYESFKQAITSEPSAICDARMDGDSEILVYRNAAPTGQGELYGIAMTGLDGQFYKISIFTGENEDCGPEAPVWQIAEVIGARARHQDFSDWGIEDAPSPAVGGDA